MVSDIASCDGRKIVLVEPPPSDAKSLKAVRPPIERLIIVIAHNDFKQSMKVIVGNCDVPVGVALAKREFRIGHKATDDPLVLQSNNDSLTTSVTKIYELVVGQMHDKVTFAQKTP